jgi:hypothetical protein
MKKNISCSNIESFMLVAGLRCRFGIDCREHCINEQANISLPLAEGRQKKDTDRDTVKKVFTEATCPDLFWENAIRSRDDAYINLLGFGGSQPGNLFLL